MLCCAIKKSDRLATKIILLIFKYIFNVIFNNFNIIFIYFLIFLFIFYINYLFIFYINFTYL